MKEKQALGHAIGKIILIGEHAVVHGEPAIAVPFSGVKMETVVTTSDAETHLDCFEYNGLLYAAPENYFGLTSLIKKVVDSFNKELFGFDIKINSSIPVERGMGSSAAVAAATVRALYEFFDEPLTDEILVDLVNFSEKIVHGNPSGIDTAIVVYEKPLYYIKNQTLENYHYDVDAYLLVADTGELGMTKFAVQKVKQYIDAYDDGPVMISELGTLTNEAKQYLLNNDIKNLARVMNEAQRNLSKLGVSNETNELLIKTAKDNGALAAKITGGGLGGCIIALCSDEQSVDTIARALEVAGAHQTWVMNMNRGDTHES